MALYLSVYSTCMCKRDRCSLPILASSFFGKMWFEKLIYEILHRASWLKWRSCRNFTERCTRIWILHIAWYVKICKRENTLFRIARREYWDINRYFWKQNYFFKYIFIRLQVLVKNSKEIFWLVAFIFFKHFWNRLKTENYYNLVNKIIACNILRNLENI